MATTLAFQLAVNTSLPDTVGAYDPEQQQFVWEGDNETTLGWPLCTYACWSNSDRCGCYTTSTACYYTYTCGLGQCGYVCDYG